jgi:hypothetical protein
MIPVIVCKEYAQRCREENAIGSGKTGFQKISVNPERLSAVF